MFLFSFRRMKLRFTTMVLIAVALPLSSPARAENKVAADNLWRLEYNRNTYSTGSLVVLLSDDAIKLETPGSFAVAAGGPKWIATVANLKEKKMCELTPAQWKHGFFLERSDSEDEFNPKKAIAKIETNYKGMPATLFRWKKLESDDLYRERSAPSKITYELIVARDIPCSKMQLELISSWLSIPYLAGIPLFQQEITSRGPDWRLKLVRLTTLPRRSANLTINTKGLTHVAKMHDMLEKGLKNTVIDFIEFDKGFDRK